MVCDNLNLRLRYQGGNQEQRFIQDKLRSLKKALLYSYQACTMERLEDGALFRCLINTDKVKLNYDTKVLSIPYYSVNLQNKPLGEPENSNFEPTRTGEIPTEIKPGVVFRWVETDTYWLITLQHIEEDAYFRAEIYRCDQQVEVNGRKYWVYIRGPEETDIPWNQKRGIMWNDMNHSLIMYITKDENTADYFHRFSSIYIEGQKWEVAATNPYYGDGIIEVMLIEASNNEYADHGEGAKWEPKDEPAPISKEGIIGPTEIYPYDCVTYNIDNKGGVWSVSNKKIAILEQSETSVTLEVRTIQQGEFTLSYITEDVTIDMPIIIRQL